MICPACGSNSQTADVCSVCRRPMTNILPQSPLPAHPALSNPAQPTMAMPPQPPMSASSANMAPGGGQYRVSLTGEVIEVAAPPPPAQPTMAMPTGGGYERARREGLPNAAYSADFAQQDAADDRPSEAENWEKFLAVGLPIVALSMWAIHQFPGAFFGIALADLFFLSMAMGATCAIPSYDDSFADCGAALLLCWLLGPLITGVVMLIASLVQQESKAAVLSLISLVFFLKMVFGLALASAGAAGSLLQLIGLFDIIGFFAVVVCFAGWILSNFFRPVNDF